MSCPSCGDLYVRYRISSPSDLSKAIKIAFQNVQDGTLREVVSPENGNGPMFSELAQGAAWDDAVILWATAIVFPLTSMHFGFYGGTTASMAGIWGVIESYRSEEVVWTRGGKVHKKDSRAGYLIPHLVLGFFLTGLMLVCILIAIVGTT